MKEYNLMKINTKQVKRYAHKHKKKKDNSDTIVVLLKIICTIFCIGALASVAIGIFSVITINDLFDMIGGM